MRVFDFTLLSGYEFSGVDVAQGFRARLFAKNKTQSDYVCTSFYDRKGRYEFVCEKRSSFRK